MISTTATPRIPSIIQTLGYWAITQVKGYSEVNVKVATDHPVK